MTTTASAIPHDWQSDIARRLTAGKRVLIGLAGRPGAGKSSLAAALCATFRDCAVIVPMDGFHLANVELARLGRADRKGAPDTFDAVGYIALLARIRADDSVVYAPEFRREIEEPIANAIPVVPEHRLVITEGNYLLMDGIWSGVRPQLDACWYVEIGSDARVDRLVDRHMRFGRSADAAREWVLRSDEANARLIEMTRGRADRQVCWPPAP